MKAKVLLIEDNADISQTIKTLLEQEGYVVTTADDGQRGIDALTKDKPDLILLDMMMPGVNGWHFLDFQRNHQDFSIIPVIVVSAFGEIAKSVHPAAYLAKPVDMNVLLETVAKHIH